jgi:hypothetical protein
MAENDTDEVPSFFEQELGLPTGFFTKLLHEDDWSFIIKLHAFFEGVITELLTKSLERDHLRGVLAQLPISDKRIGKMAFVRELSLLEEGPQKFISDLSDLRNKLVHNVRNVQFDLKEHVAKLDKHQRKNFKNNLGFAFEIIDEGEEKREDFMAESPKTIILISSYQCLSRIYLRRQKLRSKQIEDALARVIYERSQAGVERDSESS